MADSPSAQLIALADQQATAVREVARVLGSYYEALVASGLPAEHAGELVNAYAEKYWDTVWHRCCPCHFLSD